MPNTANYKEVVLNWLNHKGAGTYSIGTISEDVDEDMTRRQVTTALHGLVDRGLTGRLENVGKGLWEFTDHQAPLLYGTAGQNISDAKGVGLYRWPIESSQIKVVGESLGEGIIIRIQRDSRGLHYTVRSNDGALFDVMPIYEIETYQFD